MAYLEISSTGHFILDVKKQYIHSMVEDYGSQMAIYITVVYARNELQYRENLWSELTQVNLQQQKSWILSGDFKNVLNSEDRIGIAVTQQEIQGFQGLLDAMQLTSLRSKG